ncbi:MAG: CRISPR-associated endonuclease Cas2 [Lachnospiraceae bacterium]|nr:CRISPR-associated endonuclease Cas2 [Lachnospiraceae bacterium]
MFVILSYDVNQKRVGKVLKICRKYLRHIHKSVFEGVLTEAELNRLKKELIKIIRTEEDAICIYKMEHIHYAKKEEVGVVQQFSHII